MASFEDPRNSADSSLIDSVAFGLATLEKHGDQAREVERLVQQVSSVRKQFDGSMAELLWATENFLSSFNSGNLNDQIGSYAVLQELSQFLHRASANQETDFTNTEEVDELLERLDFLASGGTDQEIPKRARSGATPSRVHPDLKFPVEPSRLIEDSAQAGMLEHTRSTCRLLVSQLQGRSDDRSRVLMERQIQYLNSVEASFWERSSVTVAELVADLSDPIKTDVRNQTDCPRIETQINSASSDRVYKSLANFLSPLLKDLAQALAMATTNRQGATFELKSMVDSNHLAFSFALKGIKTKFADLIETTLASVTSGTAAETEHEPDQSGQESNSTSNKIRSSLNSLVESVQLLAGSIDVKNLSNGEVTIDVAVNSRTRLTQVVPVTIDSMTFAIEAQMVQAVVPTQVATCDIYRNHVVHEGTTYEYSTVGLARKIAQVASNASGFLVLMEFNSQKSAIHIERFGNVTDLVVRPSSSDVEFGNAMSLSPVNLIQLDMHSSLADDSIEPTVKRSSSAKRTSLCLCELSAQAADTFMKASSSLGADCENVQGSFETIRSIQERKPSALVFEASDNQADWIDYLRLARRYTDLSRAQVLVATTDHASQQTRYGPEFSDVQWISKDIQVPELVELLTSNLDS